MGLADDLAERVAVHHGANLEYVAGEYRLALNPVEDRYDETGFILWRQDESGATPDAIPAAMPAAVGRAVSGELIWDDTAGFDGSRDDLVNLLQSLLAAPETVTHRAGHGGVEESAPTGA